MSKRLKVLAAKIAGDGIILTEAQRGGLGKSQDRQESPWRMPARAAPFVPALAALKEPFYLGTMKADLPFIDSYAKVGFACPPGGRSVKLYDRKTPIPAADLLNDRVIPFFEAHDIAVSRILTERGYAGCTKWTPQGVNPEGHESEHSLAVEDLDHRRTQSPQTNGICERLHRTILEAFYRVTFRKCPPGDAKRQDLPEPGRAAGRS